MYLLSASRSLISRVKVQHQRLAPELVQIHQLAILVFQPDWGNHISLRYLCANILISVKKLQTWHLPNSRIDIPPNWYETHTTDDVGCGGFRDWNKTSVESTWILKLLLSYFE